MKQLALKHGDFSALADNYARYRPGYSDLVLTAILGLLEKPAQEIHFADIGAGTGIWTRQVARRGCPATAVEPNDEMRAAGIALNDGSRIEWKKGSGEDTDLPDAGFDLVSMASSFHWVDFEAATSEFARVLRPGGRFVALWNPRLIEVNPLLVEFEEKLCSLAPDMKRVSSGRSEFCEGLTDRLEHCGRFGEVLYLEGRHVERQTPEHYIGVWRSVNDVRFQAGEENFEAFLSYVERRLKGVDFVEATYATRAWVAEKT